MASQPLSGVRVLELASWLFVPAAGAVLADWGAEVVKIEHPKTGDPLRGMTQGSLGGGIVQVELANRGKRSVGLDISTPDGHELLLQLAERSDVFLTNFLPAARRRLGVDVTDIRDRNPQIIYARGSGQGNQGPDADRPGFDGTSFLARGGIVDAFSVPGEEPRRGPGAFGDLPGGYTLAGAVAAALVGRAAGQEPAVVDVSLLATAMWQMGLGIVTASMPGVGRSERIDRRQLPNPLSISYETLDHRWIKLSMFQPDRFFGDLCRHLGKPELESDPRFSTSESRSRHSPELIDEFDMAFAERTLAEWSERFVTLAGAWAPVQRAEDLQHDVQAIANGYVRAYERVDGTSMAFLANPAQFDDGPGQMRHPPEHGEHTEEVFLELGLTWDRLGELKASGTIL
jgi:crotonobetainyl-CoA:carnitine CoA-transferase CaiB-like acyl-CoA transferase